MGEFTLAGFARHTAAMVAEVEAMQHRALERAAVIVENEARAEIGTYQAEAGPFAAWAPLADATKAERAALGFTPDNPLLRTGDMRDTLAHTVRGDEAHIGSDSDIVLYQELGTSRIPPRSFLGGAAVRKEVEVREICHAETVALLTGGGAAIPVR